MMFLFEIFQSIFLILHFNIKYLNYTTISALSLEERNGLNEYIVLTILYLKMYKFLKQ